MGKALPERMSEPSLRLTSEIGWRESKGLPNGNSLASQTLGTKVTGLRTFF
jgi:hypothetical protein